MEGVGLSVVHYTRQRGKGHAFPPAPTTLPLGSEPAFGTANTVNAWLIFSTWIALFLSFPSESARIGRAVTAPVAASAGQGRVCGRRQLLWFGSRRPWEAPSVSPAPELEQSPLLHRERGVPGPALLPASSRASELCVGAVASHTQGGLCSPSLPPLAAPALPEWKHGQRHPSAHVRLLTGAIALKNTSLAVFWNKFCVQSYT